MATILRTTAPQAQQAAAFTFHDLEQRRARERRAEVDEAVAACVAARLDAELPAVRAAVDALVAAKAEWLAHWQRAALEVATAIAARVIRREVRHAPEITLDLVKESLELAAGSSDVRLRMHPDDRAALGPRVEQLAGEIRRLGDVQIVADESITRGGCRVDTRFGTIDQQFEAQLARIELELS